MNFLHLCASKRLKKITEYAEKVEENQSETRCLMLEIDQIRVFLFD